MIGFLSICRNTFVQTIRQPIYSVLILVIFIVLVMSVPLAGWTMDPSGMHTVSDQRMLLDLGVSTLLVGGLLVAAFSASSALNREIEDKTALTVISKPVSRATFVLGKFFGVAAAVAVAYYLCCAVFLMTVRHGVMSTARDVYDWPVIALGFSALGAAVLMAMVGNLLFGWTFTSAGIFLAAVLLTLAGGAIAVVGKGWQVVPFGQGIPPRLLPAMAVTFIAVLIFTAVAIAASTRLGQVMTLLVCGGVLFLGYLHPFLFASGSTNPAVRLLGWVVPNLRVFDTQDPVVLEKTIPLDYVGWAALYGAIYVTAVLALAAALFQRRALEAGTSSSTLPAAVNLLAWAGRMAALAAGIGVVVVIMSGSKYRTPTALAVAGGVLAAAAGTWALWSIFARGVKWSYWVALVLSVLVLLGGSAALAAYYRFDTVVVSRPTAAITAVLAGGVVVVLLLPRTRHHFKSAG